MKLLIILVMFLVIGALFIVSQHKLALKNQDSREEFKTKYYMWINSSFENIKHTTAYVIKMAWLPRE